MGKDLLRGEGVPPIDIPAMADYLEGVSATERIKWAANTFGINKMVMTTSGGDKAALMPFYVREVLGECPPIIFIDTGYYPASTLGVVDFLEREGFEIIDGGLGLRPSEITDAFPGWRRNPYSQDFYDAVYT